MSKIIHKESFYINLFENSYYSQKYNNIKFNETPISSHIKDTNKANINIFELFPNYLKPELNKGLTCNKIEVKPGFAINISDVNNVDDYLKNYCKTSFKKVIKRSVKRLESCFNIKYKMFYGEIDKSTYHVLMSYLYNMIANRFQQREGRNRVLEQWDYYLDLAFNKINSKKASLFVIYSNNEPIEISLNFHYDTIMYSSISSYNLDYSKFSLGNIEIYKQLEWCIDNNISFFDMGYGDFEYKRRWSNYIYKFETHIIASKNSILTKIYTLYYKNKNKLINFLISKKVNDYYYNLIEKLKGSEKKVETLKYTSLNLDLPPTNINIVDYNRKENYFLKKPVYDFLYKNMEYINNIKVYSIKSEVNSYVIKGKKSSIKIHF